MGLPQGYHTCFASRVCDTLRTPMILEPSNNPECLPSCPRPPTPLPRTISLPQPPLHVSFAPIDPMIHCDDGQEFLLPVEDGGTWTAGPSTPHPSTPVGVPGLLRWGVSRYNRHVEENSMEDIISSPSPSHFHIFSDPFDNDENLPTSCLLGQTHQTQRHP